MIHVDTIKQSTPFVYKAIGVPCDFEDPNCRTFLIDGVPLNGPLYWT